MYVSKAEIGASFRDDPTRLITGRVDLHLFEVTDSEGREIFLANK